MHDGLVESVTGLNEASLRAKLSRGATLIHYLTRHDAAGLHVEQAAVLAPDVATRDKAREQVGSAAFRARLTEIVRLALSA
ncbi:hypothetical protein ACFOLM_21385 [Deinococcus soli (ex Cha et al. 2016)]|uniref:hypothetical protein n=1 Tax=Deinococcus soli (ex Cha et al. 2016) TaxID=1309411 RepID=UPI00361813AB